MSVSERILIVALYGNSNKEITRHLRLSFEDWQRSGLNCAPTYEAVDWFAMAELYDAAQEYVKSNYSI